MEEAGERVALVFGTGMKDESSTSTRGIDRDLTCCGPLPVHEPTSTGLADNNRNQRPRAKRRWPSPVRGTRHMSVILLNELP